MTSPQNTAPPEDRGPLQAAALQERVATLEALIQLHGSLNSEADNRQVRQTVVRMLGNIPPQTISREMRYFCAEHLTPADFEGLTWESAEEVLTTARALAPPRPPPTPEAPLAPGANAYELVRYAVRHFEQRGHHTASAVVLQRMRFAALDAELREMQTLVALRQQLAGIARQRWWLWGILVAQCFLLLGFFPLMLQLVENRGLISHSQPAPPTHPPWHYIDGVYWSLMSPIGSAPGPQTPGGRRLTQLASGTKLLTVGVVAALVRSSESFAVLRARIEGRTPRYRSLRSEESLEQAERRKTRVILTTMLLSSPRTLGHLLKRMVRSAVAWRTTGPNPPPDPSRHTPPDEPAGEADKRLTHHWARPHPMDTPWIPRGQTSLYLPSFERCWCGRTATPTPPLDF